MAKKVDQDELQVREEEDDGEAFVTYDIATYPSDLTLTVLADMWSRGDIIIPEFQRNFVWTIKQASLLIESFLMGLPVPQLFFYVDDSNKYLVVDGQQRLITIVSFLEGFFGSETHGKRQVFRLTGLDDRSPYAKKRFKDLDEAAQRKLRNAVLRAINIRQLNPKEEHTSIFHIFERLNTGGTPLKPQEIRNCVFRGGFQSVLKDLNTDPNWRAILGKKTLDRHQKDVELLLRVFALFRAADAYEKPMKEFLNKAMQKDKAGDSPKIKAFRKRFPEAVRFIVEKLGPNPFHIRGPLNSSALDSVVCIVLENIDNLPSNFAARWKKLVANDEFENVTFYGTSDVAILQERFRLAHEHLIE